MTVRGVKKRLQKLGKAISTAFCKIGSVPYNIRRLYLKKKLGSRKITVISNNCWAGRFYQYLDMPYLSPTAGLYFFADDYLRFVKDLRRYIGMDISFISPEESNYKDILLKRGHDNVPIGKLDDVEIVFLHYKTKEEAKEKWDRRKARINWDDLYFKFSNMNLCTEERMREFAELPHQYKFLLNIRKKVKYPCEYYWNGESNGKEIILDTKPFPGNVPIGRIFKRTE